MTTANEFASYVAFQLGNADNFELKQRLIYSLIFYRAEAIRRDLERNKIHPDLLQTIKIPLSLINSTETEISFAEDKKILRSVDPIPHPVRIKNASPFYSVSSSIKGRKKILLTYS